MKRVAAFVVVIVVLMVLVSAFASDAPDGLERVALDHGIDGEERSGGDVSQVAKVGGLAVVFAATGGVLVAARRRS